MPQPPEKLRPDPEIFSGARSSHSGLDSTNNGELPTLPKTVDVYETATIQPAQVLFGADELVGRVVVVRSFPKLLEKLLVKLLRGRVDVLRVHEPAARP